MDFQTEYRLNGYKYTAPVRTKPCFTFRDLYREREGHLFSTWRPNSHDCRLDSQQAHCEDPAYNALLLADGIRKTYECITDMHKLPEIDEDDPSTKKPDKLLMTIGIRGSGHGDFTFPRDLAITHKGDILIADTGNHRVQIFNQFGIFKKKFGKKGSEEGQFHDPTGISLLPNHDIVVADKKNKRVQVFTPKGKFRYAFPVDSEPWSVACGDNDSIVVGTCKQTIAIHTRQGDLLHTIDLGGRKEKGSFGVQLITNDKDEIVVSDPITRTVRFYSFQGQLLHQFRPRGKSDSLVCHNSGLAWTVAGQLVVCDSLNHTVNLYSEKGELLEQYMGPVDQVGSVSACALGPEGHMVAVEFTSNGPHCFKIFRFRDCECHSARPGSSKKRPRTPKEQDDEDDD